MLNSIILKDFFSFKGENKIDLNKGANLLLGINGSGKTSFINALRLLYEGISGSGIENLIQSQWGGFYQMANFSGRDKVNEIQITYVFNHKEINKYNSSANFHSEIYYKITICPLGPTDYYLNELLWTDNSSESGKPFVYLDFHNGQGRLSCRTRDAKVKFQEYVNGDISGHELVIKQISDPIQYLPVYVIRKAIESIAVYNSFDTSESSKLRRIADFSTGIRLWKNGENLTQLLSDLKNNHSLDFGRIEETLQKINPQYKEIVISNITGQSYLSLREKNLDRVIGALHISEGTLHFLLLESIFFNTDRGTLIGIDEPERGLHPDMIRSIAEMIKFAATESQLIIATHSPHLLNQFEFEDVLVFEKNENNSTEVKKLSNTDFSDYEGDLLPGQLWLNGELGGKRW